MVNRGRAISDAFSLALTVDGQALAPQRVEALEPGEQRTVTVTGPACRPGSMLTADLDPNGEVDERSETDNRLTLTCPGP
jgi:subtilase family serine protease